MSDAESYLMGRVSELNAEARDREAVLLARATAADARASGEPMSKLTQEVRLWSDAAMGQHDKNVIALCDAHERLETEVQRLEDVVLERNAELTRLHIEKAEALTEKIRAFNEHARICIEHALLVQESGRERRELDRLEGLLREWKLAADALDAAGTRLSFDDPNFMTTVSGYQDEVDAARRAVCAEAVRLAKVQP